MSAKRIAAASALVFLLAGFWLVPHFTQLTSERGDAEYLQLFREVLTIVKTSYVEKVDDKKLLQGAINGMLSALDPHSAYMPASDFKEMQVHMAGAFGGVGLELGMRDGKLMVNMPIEDTPAFKAGILAGDLIWKIDGKPTRGLNINDAVSRMRGTPGTKVTVAILRDGVPEPLTFRLVRATIKTRSLKGKLLESGYAYVGIAEFQERTAEDFKNALRTLHAENGAPLKGLILDLRYNPGGLVDQAYLVADRFIGEGMSNGLIVSTKGRDPGSEQTLTAIIGEKEPRYPMVVLVNGGSASASEIVAGALQDHKRAVIMGTQTFGKGSVQSIIPLNNGDGLKLTTARYYTPSGRSIQAKGITPDIVVEMRKPKTPAKKKAEDEIHEKDLEHHMENPLEETPAKGTAKPAEPKEAELLARDYQLSRALDLLKGVNLLSAGLKH